MMEKTCKKCTNFNSGKCKQCKIVPPKDWAWYAETCDWYNADLPEGDICLNCKHFLGGSDWGMACAKCYTSLPRATTSACKKFEEI